MKLNINFKKIFLLCLLILGLVITGCSKKENIKENISNKVEAAESSYKVSEEEKTYLKERFDNLLSINKETIGYIYAPNTNLDEPIVQTNDNYTYLVKTFEGNDVPLLGAVFMDMDNNKNFSDKLTWLFAHARGSQAPDKRMFNDVNYYDKQDFFDEHPYLVIETPQRKYYYEVAFLIIVPETTAFYRTTFESDADFANQLTAVSKDATTKNPNIKIDSKDRYLVLSTCREEDETIRSNLYLRQIPDDELPNFLEKNAEKLSYVKTR
ncbi:class B sortase [Gemella sp. zg-570]|uniref:class B sortase, LPKTxAVK-specific n=1 Tax=Gemella sp. zg-570 TaxID=2840371 RepID=UPI001C0D6228|nr:class B sortase, LPKTxAVK-specific [Gemella sp. zg-570]QWQ38226.1 class B sortase [Gemella sp. zg-570]